MRGAGLSAYCLGAEDSLLGCIAEDLESGDQT
jgi:hypothetical protein